MLSALVEGLIWNSRYEMTVAGTTEITTDFAM